MSYTQQTNKLKSQRPPLTTATSSMQPNHIKDDTTLKEITSLIQSYNNELSNDPLYLQLLNELQVGNWEQVSTNIQHLKRLYPNTKELDMLDREVTLRIEFDRQWADKVKGKSFIFSPLKAAVRIVPIALILAMLGGGFYYVQQTRQINSITSARQAVEDQAQGHLAAGRYEEAIALYKEMLATDSENEVAVKGLADATRQLALQNDYNDGVAKLDAGNMTAASNKFRAIVEKAPGYRDVDSLLDQIALSMSIEEMYASANAAFEARDWAMAIELYEGLKKQNGGYEAETVKANLTESYLNAGLAIVALSPEQGADVEQAQTYFNKALKLNRDEPTAKANAAILAEYEKGTRALASNDYNRAMLIMETLNTENPGYLNGYITKQLFQIYMDFATRAEETNDLVSAHSYYYKAATLNTADAERTLALQKLQVASIALTPTATPTYTPLPPTPTFTPQPTATTVRQVQQVTRPPAAAAAAPAVAPPPPTATSVPRTIASYRGWILFLSNRGSGGSNLYVMQSNGADVQLAPGDAREQYDILFANEKWSPDRNAELIIPKEKTGGSSQHNIYKIRHDLPEDWTRKFRMTDFPSATYDPVWDPTNKRVAFVSNHTGGDEIWVMDTEGQNHKQLTKNSWPWDKHPTWSLNGQQLFFYSNRSGLRQIWVMNPDGSNQVQISDGQYEDWDPVVIR